MALIHVKPATQGREKFPLQAQFARLIEQTANQAPVPRGIAMTAASAPHLHEPRAATHRPIVLELGGAVIDPCSNCDARSVSVCSAIDDEGLARLAAAAVRTTLEPGQEFIAEGEPATHFFNITAGTARLFKLLPDGRRQITGFAGRGHFLGLAVSDTYAFGAEAIGPMSICRFTRSKMIGLLDEFRTLEQKLLQTARSELVTAQEQMLLLGRKTARERLASFLLAHAKAGSACGIAARTLELPMTRADIADYLGLTIETVSRSFTKLRGDGLIALEGANSVVIRNLAALEDAAGGA